jgi:Flp pilus assembly protein TadG
MRMLNGERGASAVEFAIVASLLFMILFGTVQFGMAFNRAQGLEAAAREGARAASVGGTYTQIATRVRAAQSMFDPADVAVTTSPASSGSTRPCAIAGLGGDVTVTAQVAPAARYAITIPGWGNKQITYSSAGTFRCERGMP